MRDRPTRFRENDDLPLWRGPAVKTEIMRSRDAQCYTGE